MTSWFTETLRQPNHMIIFSIDKTPDLISRYGTVLVKKLKNLRDTLRDNTSQF